MVWAQELFELSGSDFSGEGVKQPGNPQSSRRIVHVSKRESWIKNQEKATSKVLSWIGGAVTE
jgi:hypothetical protein